MIDIREELQYHVEFATNVLMHEGHFIPMVLIDGEGGRMPVMMNFSNYEEKDSNYALIKLLALAYDATQLVMMTESWLTILDHDGKVERKTEALTVNIVRRDAQVQANREIVRDADGNIIRLDDDREPTAVTVENRLASLLPKEPVDDYQKNGARDVLKMLNIEPQLMTKPTVH